MFNLIKTIAILSVSTAAATLGASLVIDQIENNKADANYIEIVDQAEECEGGWTIYRDPVTGQLFYVCSDRL